MTTKLPSLVPTSSDQAWNGWLVVIGATSVAKLLYAPMAAMLIIAPMELLPEEWYQEMLKALMRFGMNHLGVQYDNLVQWSLITQIHIAYWISIVLWGVIVVGAMALINRRVRWF